MSASSSYQLKAAGQADAARRMSYGADEFPADVVELLRYFEPAREGQPMQAVPGARIAIEPWIFGSSLFGAWLAAALGLPYAFASHFAPAQLVDALAVYRRQFQPSPRLAQPHVMLAFNVVAADTDPEARRLFTTQQQAFVAAHRPDELQLIANVFDHAARVRSFALASEAFAS